MMNRFTHYYLAAAIVALAFTESSHAATIDDIEASTGGTYLDFEFNAGGDDGVFTRNGLTATTTGSGWGYPDASLLAGTDGVNTTGMDSAGAGGNAEFQVDITGLGASPVEIFILAMGHTGVNNWGFQHGTTTGSLTNVVNMSAVGVDVTGQGVASLYHLSIGTYTPSGGSLTFFIDNNTGASPRSLIDGLAVTVVPAPAALPAGLAMLGLFAARRRR